MVCLRVGVARAQELQVRIGVEEPDEGSAAAQGPTKQRKIAVRPVACRMRLNMRVLGRTAGATVVSSLLRHSHRPRAHSDRLEQASVLLSPRRG